MLRVRTGSAALLAGMMGVTFVGLATPVANAAVRTRDASVCAGVARCRIVARVDVNGDGRLDTVALARRGKAATASVLVRVKTGPSRIVSVRRGTPYWYGGLWQGAAVIDGVAGRELVVGRTSGAHAEFFWVLTWRNGRLLTLRSPGGDLDWPVDGAVNIDVGWQRTDSDPAGLMRLRVAERQPDDRLVGTETTYRWSPGHWTETRVSTIDPITEPRAASWSGWRVPGLARY